MRISLLASGCLLAGQLGVAQQGPVSPLAPVQPRVQPAAPTIGPLPTASPTAAPTAQAPPRAPQGPGPLLLVNTRFIIGGTTLARINPQDIQSVRVYKTAAGTPEPWGELLRYHLLSGILDLTLKKPLRLPSQRLAQLGHRLRVKQAAYLLNGMAVTNTRLRIATSAIKEMTLSHTPTGPVISVQIYLLSDAPLTPHPPGTSMIRGAAAYPPAR